MHDREITPREQRELDEAANVLARMLMFWQIHRDAGYPALMFKNQAQLLREEAVKVESLIARFTPDEQARIRISPDPNISEDTATRLAALFAEDTPDTIPPDWKD